MRWQDSREPALLDEILRRCEPGLTGTILTRGGYSADFDEALNALRVRLWRKLPKYDPSKGRIFTFVSLIGSQGIPKCGRSGTFRRNGIRRLTSLRSIV